MLHVMLEISNVREIQVLIKKLCFKSFLIFPYKNSLKFWTNFNKNLSLFYNKGIIYYAAFFDACPNVFLVFKLLCIDYKCNRIMYLAMYIKHYSFSEYLNLKPWSTQQYGTFELRIRSGFYCSNDVIVGHLISAL